MPSFAPYHQALYQLETFRGGTLVSIALSDPTIWRIRPFDEAYRPGEDQTGDIEPIDMSALSPWFDMGFSELEGPLIAMTCGGFFDANNRVRVEYQLDMATAGGWTLLGEYPNTDLPADPEVTGRSDPVENIRTLLFNGLTGIAFRYVRFRFTLISELDDEGNPVTPNQTPNAYPLTLRFYKRPKMRESVMVNIDVTKTLTERPDNFTPDMLYAELKAIFDEPLTPAVSIGGYDSHMVIMGLPRVMSISDNGGEQDIEANLVAHGMVIRLNLAELI
jgi:hypothetical protein